MWRLRPAAGKWSTLFTRPASPMAALTPVRRVCAAYDPHYYAAFLRDPDGNKVEGRDIFGQMTIEEGDRRP